MKRCTVCGIEKTLSEFQKDKNSKDGYFVYCKDCVRKRSRKYYLRNTELLKKKVKEYRIKNKSKKREQDRNYYLKNKEKIRIYKRGWEFKNRERLREKRDIYYNTKQRTSIKYRISKAMSFAIRKSLKGNKNGRRWESFVNYTQQDLRKHLERQFKDGMCWGNYGKDGWVIDHKIPKSLFNITSAKCKGFKKCWELSNLQPMLDKENNRKSNKLFV